MLKRLNDEVVTAIKRLKPSKEGRSFNVFDPKPTAPPLTEQQLRDIVLIGEYLGTIEEDRKALDNQPVPRSFEISSGTFSYTIELLAAPWKEIFIDYEVLGNAESFSLKELETNFNDVTNRDALIQAIKTQVANEASRIGELRQLCSEIQQFLTYWFGDECFHPNTKPGTTLTAKITECQSIRELKMVRMERQSHLTLFKQMKAILPLTFELMFKGGDDRSLREWLKSEGLDNLTTNK
jgi:hypothetical protein